VEREFERLVLECQGRVRAYVAGLGIEASYVDDIVQEAFLRYHRARRPPEGVDAVGWLKGIARNLALEHLRRERRRTYHQRAAVLEMLDRSDAAFASQGREELAAALRECLERVPSKGRALLELRYCAGADSREIARRRNSTATAVRMALSRLRAALRDCISLRLSREAAR
jgi:RNA polymerase sigma-70 factor (ECF subfamily)